MDLQEQVNGFCTAASDDHQAVVQLLVGKKCTFLDLIRALQLYITNNSTNVRSRAFLLLERVMQDLPAGLLYATDVKVLVSFLLAKLDDEQAILKHVFGCLKSLVSMTQYEPSDDICQTFIEKYQPRNYPAVIRVLPLDLALAMGAKDVNQFPSFIPFFLKISQNEKDPNNLLKVFQIVQLITSSSAAIENYANDLFDSVFKYYPISFKSSNETQRNQIDLLKNQLNLTLNSSPLFLDDMYMNLVDKFSTSTSSQVKLDILQTVQMSFTNSAQVNDQHFISLWNCIKYEVLNFDLAQIVGQKSILNYYSNSTNDHDQSFAQSLLTLESLFSKVQQIELELVFNDLSKNISIESAKFNQSCLILSFLPTSARDIIDKSFDKILSQPIDRTSNKRQLLTSLSYFSNYHSKQFINYQNEILTLLQTSLNLEGDDNSSLVALACQSTIQFLLIPDFLIDEQDILFSTLGNLLINNSQGIIKRTLIDCLKKISTYDQFESVILREIYGPIFAHKPKGWLELIGELTINKSLIYSLIIRLLGLDVDNNILDTIFKLINKLPLDLKMDQFMKFLPQLLEKTNTDMGLFYIGLILRRMIVNLTLENVQKLLSEVNSLTLKLIALQGLNVNVSLADLSVDPIALLGEALSAIPRDEHSVLKVVHLSSISNLVNKQLSYNDVEPFLSKSSLDTQIWLLRGLILKNDSQAYSQILTTLSTMEDLALIKMILRILFLDIPTWSADNNTASLEIIYKCANGGAFGKPTITNWVIRNVWKQRIYHLIHNQEQTNSTMLILLLMKLPQEIYQQDMVQIIPMIMQTLSRADDNEVLIGIFTILNDIQREAKVESSHIDSIFQSINRIMAREVPAELKLAIWAYLATLGCSREPNLAQLKDSVIDLCVKSLMDESNRDIRFKIVKTRQVWENFGLNLAGADDHHGHSH